MIFWGLAWELPFQCLPSSRVLSYLLLWKGRNSVLQFPFNHQWVVARVCLSLMCCVEYLLLRCLYHFTAPMKHVVFSFLFVACAFGRLCYHSWSSWVFLLLFLSQNTPKADSITNRIQNSWWPGPASNIVAWACLLFRSKWLVSSSFFFSSFLLPMGGRVSHGEMVLSLEESVHSSSVMRLVNWVVYTGREREAEGSRFFPRVCFNDSMKGWQTLVRSLHALSPVLNFLVLGKG